MPRLFYLPLESYVERYTYFMSCPGGWAEDWFHRLNADFRRVEGARTLGRIRTGSVLDAHGRSVYALSQIAELVKLLEDGSVRDSDVVYTEDFWTPGVECLSYIRHLSGTDFKLACFCHAQSIDDTDFCYPMRSWMGPLEVGLSRIYDYVFFCSPILRRLARDAGWCGEHLYLGGLPYNSLRLKEQLQHEGWVEKPKEDFVLFASRFDSEKNPHFFLDLVQACPEIQFKLVQPRQHISNDPAVVHRLAEVVRTSGNLEVVDTSRKSAYYDLLTRAKVLFNCAKQDWVSWVLLEGITFGCNPLFPRHKDFPAELAGFEDLCIYENMDLEDAARKLRVSVRVPFDSALNGVVSRHNMSWEKMLREMRLLDG